MTGPSLGEIQQVREAIAPNIVGTPMIEWRGDALAARAPQGAQVFVKLELFQKTGTFKLRGALANLASRAPAELAHGVTAISAGNHAIAVAYAAQALKVPAKVVMLATANPYRVERCRSMGAEVLMAETGAEGFALAEKIAADEGKIFVHPFDHPGAIAGTATIGLEMLEAAPDLDAIIIPIGGGGLIAGIAAAVKLVKPGCQVFGVEPTGSDVMYQSFQAGSPQAMARPTSIADSLCAPFAGTLTYAICRETLEDLVLVTEDEIRVAMRTIYADLRFVVEPACAVATAALLHPLKARLAGKKVGVIFCGSNISAEGAAQIMGVA